MRVPRSLLVTALVLLLLAGCAGKSAPKTTSAVATKESGAIRGLVVDDEQAPVAGAAIGVRSLATDAKNATVSASDGRFAFSGLEPGEYEVAVTAAFYDPVSKQVSVVADQIAEVSLTLLRVAQQNTTEPLIVPDEKGGFITLSYSFPWTGGSTLSGSLGQGSPNEKSHFPLVYDDKKDLKEVLLELVWTPTGGGMGERLQLSICTTPNVKDSQNNCFNIPDSPAWSNRTQGKSPIVFRVFDLPLKEHKEYQIMIGDGGGDGRPPITFQQSFKLYTSICYNAVCPPDYQMRAPDA